MELAIVSYVKIRFVSKGIFVWRSIKLGSRTPVNVFNEGTVYAYPLTDEVL